MQVRHALQTPLLQPKLTVGAPDDPFEREADQVADQLTRMPDAVTASADEAPPRIQRMCAECEEERVIRRIPLNPEATPFDGEIVSWSAALRAAPRRQAQTLADLPRGQRVTVLGGRAWIQVKTTIDDQPLTGYVSHELIRSLATTPVKEASTEKVAPTSVIPDHFTYDPALDPELKTRFNRMVQGLIDREIRFGELTGLRTRATAHRFSTAHNIFYEHIPLSTLQALPNGRDLDGNLWYDSDWEKGMGGLGATLHQMKQNARQNALEIYNEERWWQGIGIPEWARPGASYPGFINYAEEGYPADDPRRAPNLSTVPISNHVGGNAVDLKDIHWEKFEGGAWGDEANTFVDSFGLRRPYPSEPWHFELSK